jgi:hypothetical protein
MQNHYDEQMRFLHDNYLEQKEAGAGVFDAFVNDALDLESVIVDQSAAAEQGDGLRDVGDAADRRAEPLFPVAGDGQHTRQTRQVYGNSLTSVVALISISTGAVLIQVILHRKDLEKANDAVLAEAKRRFPNEDKASKLAREKYIADTPGFGYFFKGRTYYTSYRSGEHGGLDIALQILRYYLGQDAPVQLAYDKLSTSKLLLGRHFPKGTKHDDGWHAQKALFKDSIELEKNHSDLLGVCREFSSQLKSKFLSTSESPDQKVAWAQSWKFADSREEQAEFDPNAKLALEKLLNQAADAFKSTKGGYSTAFVESYFSTHDSFWSKGQKYSRQSMFVHMSFQALQWNRVKDWPKVLFDVCRDVLFK